MHPVAHEPGDLAARERARVARHIHRAERAARAASPARLAPATRWTRALLLDALARYRRAGRFPHLHASTHPTPLFVDPAGTRCAVAHLLELGGEAALVARIARTRNRALVRELADEPRLRAWLAAAGLTAAEAAAIQPTYCFIPVAACVCWLTTRNPSSFRPADAVLEGTIIQGPGDGGSRGEGVARVEQIYGNAVGVRVGDLFVAEIDLRVAAPCTRVIASWSNADGGSSSLRDAQGRPYLIALAVDPGDTVQCDAGSPESAWVPPLPRATVREALRAPDCVAALAATDPVWSASRECTAFDDAGFARRDVVPPAPVDPRCQALDAFDGGGVDASPGTAGAATLHGGCAVRAPGEPTPEGVLCALVSALIAQRGRARRRGARRRTR